MYKRQQEALVDAQQAEDAAENVKVISRAQYANKGRNMHKWAWLGATAAWGFLLFFIAMIRVFLDPRLYSVPGALHVVPTCQPEPDMEPMYAPVQDPLQDPFGTPIPEAVPAFGSEQPMEANPYEVQPAYGETNPYDPQPVYLSLIHI